MNKIRLFALSASALLASTLVMRPAMAAKAPTQAQIEAQSMAEAKKEAEALAPTAKDMAKAQADRDKGVETPRNNRKETTIEAVRDQDNRVTEYVVTPGSTHIPYTMENQAERPIDSTPGSNSQGTLGTTKLLKFGF